MSQRYRVCSLPACPRLTDDASGRCNLHPYDQSSRNHHGVPRQARGLGAEFDAAKRAVIERDGGVCQLRLPGCTVVATTADHVVPRSRGGSNAPSNLRASCGHCNHARGARPLSTDPQGGSNPRTPGGMRTGTPASFPAVRPPQTGLG